MVFKKKIPIIKKYYWNENYQRWKESTTKQLSPILIPPIDEYEVTILLKENILKMKSKLLKFEFPLDDIEAFILDKVEKEKLEEQQN